MSSWRPPDEVTGAPGPGFAGALQPPRFGLALPAKELLGDLLELPELRVFVNQGRFARDCGGGDPTIGHGHASLGFESGGDVEYTRLTGYPLDRERLDQT